MSKKIELGSGKVVTREGLFEAKKQFHAEQARLPFEEKIKILVSMRGIVDLKRAG